MISVIVAVYGVEKYLDQCIQSIVDQTYKDLEIILVDDGSKDSGGAICDAWAQKDSRIQVIHQENAGISATRNTGLDRAKGDYIVFVDGDDYLHPQAYEFMLNCALDQGADYVSCLYQDSFEKEPVIFESLDHYHVDYCFQDHCLRTCNQEGLFSLNVVWNKLFKKELIGTHRFCVGRKIEDTYFILELLPEVKKMVHIQDKLYAYRQREGSILHDKAFPYEDWYWAYSFEYQQMLKYESEEKADVSLNKIAQGLGRGAVKEHILGKKENERIARKCFLKMWKELPVKRTKDYKKFFLYRYFPALYIGLVSDSVRKNELKNYYMMQEGK